MALSLRMKINEIKRQRKAEERSKNFSIVPGELVEDIQQLRKAIKETKQNVAISTENVEDDEKLCYSPDDSDASKSDVVGTRRYMFV